MQETQGSDMQTKTSLQAHQRIFLGIKTVFFCRSLIVFPHPQAVALIQTTVSASCAAWASITSCHLGKQLLHRKAKGIKGIPPVFTEPRDNMPFQSNEFVCFFKKISRVKPTSLKKDMSALLMAIHLLSST